jgi:hypothetical protein
VSSPPPEIIPSPVQSVHSSPSLPVLIDRPPLPNDNQLVLLSDEQFGDSCDDDILPSLLFNDPEFINFSGDLAPAVPVASVA